MSIFERQFVKFHFLSRIERKNGASLKQQAGQKYNIDLIKENGKTFCQFPVRKFPYLLYIDRNDNIQHDIKLNPWDYKCRRRCIA